jgi:hypothetical protein
LDRPDSTLLLVIIGVCIVGLAVLAVATFFPGLSARLRRGGPADAYPTEPVQLADRLSATGYDGDDAEEQPEPAVESVTVVPAPTRTTTKTAATKAAAPKKTPAKRTPAKKAAAKRAPAKAAARTRSKPSAQD